MAFSHTVPPATVHKASQEVGITSVSVPKNTHSTQLQCLFLKEVCTGLVQSLDMILSKPFKGLVDAQYNDHLEANVDVWVVGKISASEPRISTWEICCRNEDTG